MTARLLRGSVLVAAVHIDTEIIGAASARRRLLAAWTRGTDVRCLGAGWLLVWPVPRRMRTFLAPGMPFERRGRSLFAVDVDERTAKSLDLPVDAVVRLVGGALVFDELPSLPREDPSAWLDVEGYDMAIVDPLALPPLPPSMTVPQVAPLDLRERLSLPADPEADRVAASLVHGPASPAPGPSMRARLRSLMASLARLWPSSHRASRSIARSGAPSGDTARPGLGNLVVFAVSIVRRVLASLVGGSSRSDRRGPSEGASSLRLAWNRIVGRFLLLTRLSSLIGVQHARYLARVMRSFEEGDLEAALRQAVPLGQDGRPSELLSWATRRPRASLAISAFGLSTTSAVAIGTELFQTLTRLYREAHQRLDSAGRIDEAAFVLAELLRANEEAVAFLERHGRLRLAAELAEGRDLAPGLQVRQWFLAGETARALEIAWRHEAFADAIVRLERSGKHDVSATLRLRWADCLASAGHYAAAVDAVWPIAGARELALRWIGLAIEQGGPAGARMLARRLQLEPAAFEDIRRAAESLLSDDSVELLPARAAFAYELGKLLPSALTSTMARPAVRAMVRDIELHGGDSSAAGGKAIRQLVELSGGTIAADLPPLDQGVGADLRSRTPPLLLEWSRTDTGRLAAEDLAFLPDGRLVLALGELGVRVLSREGRSVADIDQPASHLVISDRGDRAIGLVPRGEVWRLAQLDLAERRGRSWCEARLSTFARDYDGRCWFVAGDDFIHAIDVPGSEGGHLDGPWRVGDVRVGSIRRVEKGLQLLVRATGAPELWVYETPSLKLRRREAISAIEAKEHPVVLADGRVVVLAIDSESVSSNEGLSPDGIPGLKTASLRVTPERTSVLHLSAGLQSIDWLAAPGWLLLREDDCDGQTVRLMDTESFEERARLRLGGASKLVLRVAGARLAMADDLGRIIVLDLDSGRLLRDLRL